MGADGLRFDEVHLPRDGCWHTGLAAAFTKETGLPPPKVKDESDPLYRRYLEFQAAEIEKAFVYWRDGVKKNYPEAVFIVSSTFVPSLVNYRMTTNLVRLADSAKNEYHHALRSGLNLGLFEKNPGLAPPDDDLRMALGWTILRDAAGWRRRISGRRGSPIPITSWVSSAPSSPTAWWPMWTSTRA